MIDVARALKTASTTGEVRFGLEQTRKSVKSGEAKMVVFSSNCPAKDELTSAGAAKTLAFPGTNVELGAACGKPYAISALAIIKPGDSNILSVQ
ncbi:MAG TPA: 50S ribosomal protein L30e [Thermoplasmata archaeon]|nr:50S ribosomal protein L30e [Thermoplasmata archaeon]